MKRAAAFPTGGWILGAALILLSCSPSPTGREVRELKSLSPENQSLLFWYQADYRQEPLYRSLVERFNRENPWGIRVEAVNRGSFQELWNGAVPLLGTPSQPDLVLMTPGPEKPMPWAEQTRSFFPYLKSREWSGRENFTKGAWKSLNRGLWRSSLVETDRWILPRIPVLLDPNLVYYNRDRLRELGYDAFPSTPEQFRQICESAGIRDDLSGFIFPPDAQTILTMAYAAGWTARDSSGNFQADEMFLEQTETFLGDMIRSGAAHPAREKFDGQMEFSSGEYLFSLDTASGLDYYQRSVESSRSVFQWSTAPFPEDPKKGTLPVWEKSFFLLPSEPSRELAGWLFVRWCLDPEIQAELAWAERSLPVNPDAYPFLETLHPGEDRYREILETGKNFRIQTLPWTEESRTFFELYNREWTEKLGN